MLPDLDLQQLRMFWTLAKTHSFTRTAQQLYRTQSAVSHAIRKLEGSVGAKLFFRTGREIKLTDEGQDLYQACDEAFEALAAASESIALKKGQPIGKLRLGATVEFGCSILMKHMQAFMKDHPKIEMDFYMSHELITPLMNDELDIIIDCKVHSQPVLQRTALFREKYVVVCSENYRKEMNISSLDDLGRCNILTIDPELVWWHHFIYSLPEIQRPVFERIVTINHIRGIITAAKSSIGVAFVPHYSVLNDISQGELVILFPELVLLEDRFVIYQKRKRAGLIRHQLLTDYLKQINPQEFGG